MTFNPYEYTETPKPDVLPDNDGEFPPTPFTLKLAYREKPCLMTVERDHLLIEGESLREPILMQRHERYRLNSCFYYSGGNLIIWHRPTRKEYTFRVEERGTVDLKVAWILAWKEGVPDNRTPEEHVKKMSDKWLYGQPIRGLLWNIALLGIGMIYIFMGHGVKIPSWFMTILIVCAIVTPVSLVLMFCRIKEGILLAGISIFAVYFSLIISAAPEQLNNLSSLSLYLLILVLFTGRFYIMIYVRASRLQRQIRENPNEY